MMKESGINENQMANRNYVTTMMTTVKKQQKETHGNIEIGKLHATNRRRKEGMMKDVGIHSQGDDQILLTALVLYIIYTIFPMAANLPWWRTDGVILTTILHAGPVEFLYYWLHRALHHHYLYSRYHSHHHSDSSIVTEPITAVTHPFAELLAYFTLFLIPLLTTLVVRKSSLAAFFGYIFYIDFMNSMGHCNFEFFPKKLFSYFPQLKYLSYTPSVPWQIKTYMTCKLFDDLKDICKVHKSVEGMTIKLGVFEAFDKKLKHILHMDLSDVKLNELLKSNNLDAQRTTCLMRKILQVVTGWVQQLKVIEDAYSSNKDEVVSIDSMQTLTCKLLRKRLAEI
ncbi:Very-long-chain aldehyde decarbonylase cer1, variant 2 [Trifolium repens]|nr:Very-long-chain aldehyde decarbonylase cer1, variant 2 [Trifolium repens]